MMEVTPAVAVVSSGSGDLGLLLAETLRSLVSVVVADAAVAAVSAQVNGLVGAVAQLLVTAAPRWL
jgi:hypothetical protein